MNILELFSGTGSISKTFKRRKDISITSLDIHPKYNPTICTNILKWNYKMFKPGQFLIVWASPPCTEYSRAKSTGIRNLELADKIVKRTLKIIRYLKPKFFFIENPLGMLRHRPFMQRYNMLRKECSYCMYGRKYRKHTDIWTNAPIVLKSCSKLTPCRQKRQYNVHTQAAQNGPSNFSTGFSTGAATDVLYEIPQPLLKSILSQIQIDI
jgi:hypothetical protein